MDAILRNPVHAIGREDDLSVGHYQPHVDVLTNQAIKMQNLVELGIIEWNNRTHRMDVTTYGQEYFIRKYEHTTKKRVFGDPEVDKSLIPEHRSYDLIQRFETSNCLSSTTASFSAPSSTDRTTQPIHVEEIVDHEFDTKHHEKKLLSPSVGKKSDENSELEG